MLNFETLSWKNFLSTGDVPTEVELNQHKTTLIVGQNGAGKSTILDALSYVLYNKPFRNVNKPQLINSITAKHTLVEVKFSIGSNMYHIKRGMKPAIFEVYRDGKMLNQDAETRDYQDELEKKILKMNHKSFCQIVVLGSASFVHFMQLPAQHRREVIEDLLDIQIFSVMNALLKTRQSDNNNALTQVDYDLNLTSAKLKMQNDHLDIMSRNTDDHIARLREDIAINERRITVDHEHIAELSIKIDDAREAIGDQEKIKGRLGKVQLLEKQLLAKIEKLRADIAFFHDNDSCPTCKQQIDQTFKCETVDHRGKEITETDDAVTTIRDEIKKCMDRVAEITKINSEITDYNLQVAAYNTTILNLSKQNAKLKREIDDLMLKANEYTVDNEQLKDYEELLISLNAKKNELIQDKDALGVSATILKDSGIKAKLVKQYIPVINKVLNKYLAAMDFFVNFELDENFKEKIMSRYRDEFSYGSFSEGEKMRINLAILFTWRAIAKQRNSASTNILILDEILDGSLDNDGTDEFLKILNNITSDANTIIISHKVEQSYDKFENVLRFEKHKNFSRIAA